MSGNDNPGNFANRPKEEVKAAAQKGGQHSHSGGFASMDPDKQVYTSLSQFPSQHFTNMVNSTRSLQRAARPHLAASSPAVRKPRKLDAKEVKHLRSGDQHPISSRHHDLMT